MACHSKWLRNNPQGPHGPILGPFGVGVGGWGPRGGGGVAVGTPQGIGTLQERQKRESQVAERIRPEKMNWVGGMRVAYMDFYR